MSQEQARRPPHDDDQQKKKQEPVKYGDVFQVSGELAEKPVAPQDAAMMQTAESRILGQTQKGGPAAAMQAAAAFNESAGLVSHAEVTEIAGQQGVTVTETDVPGSRIITEAVGGQVVGQYVQPTPATRQPETAAGGYAPNVAITIGEALEAAGQTAGEKAVDQSDAAAIQAAVVRATGVNAITPGGLASTAQSAASYNENILGNADKVKLGDVLTGATDKLPADKPATRQDAEGVTSAELRNDPNIVTHPGGVAASMAAAARLNERRKQ